MDKIVPKRLFGNTGVEISQLCLGGGSFSVVDGQSLIDKAIEYGVDSWEIVSFTGKTYCEYFKKTSWHTRKSFCIWKSLFNRP